ncbi:MAG: hypothetical protein WC879_05695 [Melioribacteraceae bacterium]
MTDKEIYKARSKGFERISTLQSEVSDERFLEFMGSIHKIISKNKINLESIKQEVLEKAEIRKKLVQLFSK